MVEGARLKDLNVKLLWLTVFRTVATSLLLGATTLRLLSTSGAEELSSQDSFSFLVIGLVYALTLGYGVLLRRGRAGPRVAYVQVMGDVVLASALVFLTGGPESPFNFTYSLAVIAAAILLEQRGALVAAAASALAYGGLVFSNELGVLHAPGSTGGLATGRLVFLLVSNTLAQLLIAVLASYLSRQLTAAGGALREREADLQRLAQLQEHILTAMPSGLITGDRLGRVTFVNRAGRLILGLPIDQEVEGALEDLLPGVSSFAVGARRRELTVQTAAGPRTLGMAVAPLEPDATGSSGTLVVFQDLTELRRAERELRRVDQLAALGSLSAQLAHEVRNPLAAMRGAAQMLSELKEEEREYQPRLTNILLRESDRLSVLVDDFLRFARPQEPDLAACDLGALANETLEMVKLDTMAQGVSVESSLEPLQAAIDAGQIKQVLLNLLRNAFTAAGSGGKVRLSVEEHAQSARIKVWDSAGAIPEGNLVRIFEPFFTTRQGGTGLGLSTAHSIVRAHRGQIHVNSSPATGTEFVVELPLVGPLEARLASAGR